MNPIYFDLHIHTSNNPNLLQVLVLFISFISEIFVKITKELNYNIDYIFYQMGNLFFNTITLFFIIRTLSLIPYVVSNIFIFGETHHELLKNILDEEQGKK